ncbi:MAG TPA: retropepsin-like aspartic protease [Candidatus Limnocylindrales bacterium]|nr:retropepsin-like aspartic protease [Candidatus Limnocylindrales bacterium]
MRFLLVSALLAIASPAAAVPVAVIPFTDNGKLPSLAVRVGGSQPLPFVLDSGASRSVIDAQTARRLGLQRTGVYLGTGAGAGRVPFDVYRDVALSAGAARWTAPTAWGIALGSAGTTLPEAGLVGSDFFFRFVVDVDYAAHRITVYDPRTYHHTGPGTALPIAFHKRLATIPATLAVPGRAPQRRTLTIDTGSEDELDDALVATTTGPKRYAGSTGLGRSAPLVIAPVDWIAIGPYRLRNITGASGRVPIVGSGLLRRFHVTFDYAHRRLYLQPYAAR